jgi:hypothetical protein
MNQRDLFVPATARTLADAQDEVQIGRDDGIECPCCGQWCKVYIRKLSSSMARWLIELVRRHDLPGDWIDVRTFNLRGGDYAKVAYWDLAESRGNDDPTKRTSGLWRPTMAGIKFVWNEASVPSHVYVYDGRVLGYSSEPVWIRQALGSRFNYEELMKAR